MSHSLDVGGTPEYSGIFFSTNGNIRPVTGHLSGDMHIHVETGGDGRGMRTAPEG